jgi:hypothetical protein
MNPNVRCRLRCLAPFVLCLSRTRVFLFACMCCCAVPETLGDKELILINHEILDYSPSLPERVVRVLSSEAFEELNDDERAAGDVYVHNVTYYQGEYLPADRFGVSHLRP